MTSLKINNVDSSKYINFNFTELSDGLLLINNNHFFTSELARDNYFAENPEELTPGMLISVNDIFQQYTGGLWVDKSAVAVGPQGPTGPSPNSKWHENYPTHIAFQQEDGSWGDYSDIRGPEGPRGVKPDHYWDLTSLAFQNPDGSWGALTNLKGETGAKGDSGTSFNVDQTGTISERSNYDSEAEGFSFLATDECNLYFRKGDPGNWSNAVPFQTQQQIREDAFKYSLVFG